MAEGGEARIIPLSRLRMDLLTFDICFCEGTKGGVRQQIAKEEDSIDP